MAIGDDLFTLLGLVPSRDRAGIARGTMADEAKASISANSGNAEGRALIDQGARPPDFELPADIPTAYAAGKQRAAPYGGSGVISSVMPPPPSERVVASGPAAAPPPAVVRNSDILLEAHRRQAQAQRMQQIIGSIGMIANAFNRNPDSQAATKQSLGAMVAGGGGGGLPDLKTLLEMRDAETNTERMVDQAKRMFGLSDQDARARAATGELTKLFAPDQIRQRAGDELAARTRMDLMKPEVVEVLSKRLGQPKEVIEAGIRSGKIGPKELTDIEKDQATTAHTQATTGKVNIENMTALQKKAFVADVMSSPEQYAALWGVTPDEVRTAAHGGPEGLQKLVEGIAPKKTDTQQDLAVENRMRKAKGLPELTPSEFKYQSQRPHIKDPAAEGEEKAYEERLKEIRGIRDKAVSARDFIEVDNEAIGRKLTEASPKLMLGPFSEKVLEHRRFLADLLKLPSKTVNDTDAFKSELREYGLKINDAFKGNFSDKDQKTVNQIIGVEKYTKDTLRNVVELREKHKLLEWQNERKKLKEAHDDPVVGKSAKKFSPDVSIPKMSTLMRERFDAEEAKSKAKGELTATEYLIQNRNNPKALAIFDREWGAGRAEDFLSKLPAE